MHDFKYAGAELEMFAAVHNWKSYWSRRLRPFMTGDVLEAGAGLGANTRYLDGGGNRRWVCLEPDARLTAELTSNLAKLNPGHGYEIVRGTVPDLEPGPSFDAITYIDVLEHVEDDRGELEAAAARLKPGGRIVVLAPAHPWLFTPFDAAIGHFRRYNRAMLRAISPPSLRLEQAWYLDSLGLALSIANRFVLRQRMPTPAQLHFWDRWVIPVSRVLDRCLAGSIGKSIVAVWRKE